MSQYFDQREGPEVARCGGTVLIASCRSNNFGLLARWWYDERTGIQRSEMMQSPYRAVRYLHMDYTK